MARHTGSAPASPPAPAASPRRSAPRPAVQAPAPGPARPVRRPGRLGRFLRNLFIVVLLIALPVLAAVFAYGIGNGRPPLEDAKLLLTEILRLIGLASWFHLLWPDR
jgi:hypothetical protein